MPDVTLKKLADMLNLSISTVSRALKDHPDIALETRQKVKELADVLDYEPNTYAVNLRTNHSREFGVIIPAIDNDFYQSFISSLEEDARLNGYSLIILLSGNNPVIELESLKRCRKNRVSGIFMSITSKTTNVDNYLKLGEHPIPVIFFDKVPPLANCNKICVDDVMAATIAAETLIAKNKKKIVGVFGDGKLSITQKRLNAFHETFAKFKVDVSVNIYNAESTNEAFDLLMAHLNGNKPDAVFCMSDEILIGVMKAVQTLRLRIPEDLGIIAISEGTIPTFYFPQITYIETSGFKLAKMAFSKMLACLAGSLYMHEFKIESVLVEGGSL